MKYYYIKRNRPVCRHFRLREAADRRRKDMPMEIEYEQVGDYLLPLLALSDPPNAPPLGRYGMMHKSYLQEHRPILYNRLLLTERLYPLSRDIDKAAEHRIAAIADRAQAEEIINELIYE